MRSSIRGDKISQTPGYGHLDEDGGPLPFFRWLVLVTDLGVHLHREDWIPPFRNLRVSMWRTSELLTPRSSRPFRRLIYLRKKNNVLDSLVDI